MNSDIKFNIIILHTNTCTYTLFSFFYNELSILIKIYIYILKFQHANNYDLFMSWNTASTVLAYNKILIK